MSNDSDMAIGCIVDCFGLAMNGGTVDKIADVIKATATTVTCTHYSRVLEDAKGLFAAMVESKVQTDTTEHGVSNVVKLPVRGNHYTG